jgi:hypothetical protein
LGCYALIIEIIAAIDIREKQQAESFFAPSIEEMPKPVWLYFG